jgi:hypothetical protein
MNVVRGEISPVVLFKIIRAIELNLRLEGVNVASKRYAELYYTVKRVPRLYM